MELTKSDPRLIPLYCQPWQILVRSQQVLHNIDKYLYDHVQAQNMYDYWSANHTFSCPALNKINWDALGNAANNLIQTRLQWTIKNTADWLPHNVNKFCWNMTSKNGTVPIMSP